MFIAAGGGFDPAAAGAGLEPPIAWVYAREGGAATSVLIDPSGDVISAGSEGEQMAVVRHSAVDGSEKWRYRTIPGGPTAMLQAGDGTILVAAHLGGPPNYPWPSGGVVVKLAADGTELWRLEPVEATSFLALAIDAGGDVLAGGAAGDPLAAKTDLILVKLDGSTGREIWRRVIAGATEAGNGIQSIALDARGDVLAGGWIENPAIGIHDFAVLKFSGESGEEIWRRLLSEGTAYSIAVDREGDVAAAGEANFGTASWCDFVTAKFSGVDGSELWRAVLGSGLGGDVCDVAVSTALDPAGDVLSTGWVGGAFTTTKFARDSGALLWEHQLPGGQAKSVRVDAAGDVFAVGDAFYPANSDMTAVALRGS
ncbi:MAG: PQQ-binding-like beta-propeller repeat protein, partial [Candidatus Binatia bacterium]